MIGKYSDKTRENSFCASKAQGDALSLSKRGTRAMEQKLVVGDVQLYLPTIVTMRVICIVLLLIGFFLLSGCASVFVPYPSRMQDVRDSVGSKNLKNAIKAVKKMDASQNKQLQGIELGRLQQLGGNFKASEKTYAKVIKNVRANQLAAQVRVSHILENTSSLFVNDRVIPYQLSDYEIVFLYGYQALNYLGMNDLSGALVSIRRAQNEQEWVRQQHLKEVVKAEKSASRKNFRYEPKKYNKYFNNLNQIAAQVRGTRENAFLYYLSGVLYIAKGDMNDAFVSLKNALKVAPNNKEVQHLLLEVLARRGGNLEQLHQYMKQFGVKHAPQVFPNDALVVVLFEQGLVPQKEQIKIPVPLYIDRNWQIQHIAFPTYRAPYRPGVALRVELNAHQTHTSHLMSVYPLAARALKDDLPTIFIRQALSTIVKAAAVSGAQHASKKDQTANDVAGALLQLYSAATSGADLRSWLTLPNSEQIFDQFAPAANPTLNVFYRGKQRKIELNLKPRQVNLVWIVGQGSKLIVHNLPIQGSTI